MKLQAKVAISNRSTLNVFNGNQNRKRPRSVLSICGRPIQATATLSCPDQSLYLLISNPQIKPSDKYILKNNVEQVFTQFVREGKSTLRMKSPPHDIIISEADPVQLKSFLTVLSLAFQKGHLKTEFISKPPTKVQLQPAKLVILKRSQYPLAFSGSINILQISFINLLKVPLAVIALPNLKQLNLSDNEITVLTLELFAMKKLVSLNMSNNQIKKLPINLPKSCIEELNLAGNQVESLPDSISNLEKLSHLNTDNNCLFSLPDSVGRLKCLQKFSAKENQLKFLPWSFSKLRFKFLDLSGNPFNQELTREYICNLNSDIVSLLSWAAAAVINNRIPVSAELIPFNLVEYLKMCRWCPCGKPVFSSVPSIFLELDLRAITNILQYNNRNRNVPVSTIICSSDCLKKLKPF